MLASAEVCTDFAPGMLAFNCVTMFPLSVMHLFSWCCCTACDLLLVCHKHGHMITCKQSYLLPVPRMGFIWITLIKWFCNVLSYVGRGLQWTNLPFRESDQMSKRIHTVRS
jgi:hypothetical protein